MIVLFPTGSDAPLRHWPIATGVTIAINLICYGWQLATPEFTESFMLIYGTFHPITWLTAAYLHADLGHLIGNMMFLFIYGLIIEGKTGWWRFLLVYNACAVSSGILISLWTMSFTTGACLGASCAIFGLMLICFLWAPENEVSFLVAGVFFYRPFIHQFEVAVQNLCFFFVALNLVIAAFTEFAMSSEVLHLLGIAPGVFIGWAMIRFRQVNCDGHDLISIMGNKRGQSQLTHQEEAEQQERKLEQQRKRRAKLEKGMEMVNFYLQQQHYEMAVQRFDTLRRLKKGLVMDESLMVQLINGLEKQPAQTELYRTMLQRYLEHYQTLAHSVKLKLAKLIFTTQQAPRRVLRTLAEIDRDKLNRTEQKIFLALVKRAKQQVADGVIELQETKEHGEK